MLSALIVDDEEHVREAIKILAEWERLGIGQIFEAQNGKEALEIQSKYNPQIVLLDMKMPEVNGIEFLKEAKINNPDASYIVISGYDHFEFTKQAVKSNVIDYILKPINKAELNAALTKALEKNQEIEDKRRDSIDKNITINILKPVLIEKIYTSIVEGNYNQQTKDIVENIAELKFDKMVLGVLVFKILYMDEKCKQEFNDDNNLLHFALSNVINESLNGEFECFSFRNPKDESEIIAILSSKNTELGIIKRTLYDLLKVTAIRINKIFGIELIVGVGNFCSEITHIEQSYTQAKQVIESANLLDSNDNILFEIKRNVQNKFSSILVLKGIVKKSLENSTIEVLKNNLIDYMNKIKESGYFSLNDAKRLITEFLHMLTEIALETGIPYTEIPTENEYKNAVGNLNFQILRFKDYITMILKISDYAYSWFHKYVNHCHIFNINDIKDYIDNKYHEKIKLSTFTDKYFLSREYLMKKFKKEFSCGIYEYVLKVRMEKARDLLNDPSIKIQHISEMVGYSDNNYFSKAFRTYYSISPTEYRHGLQK